MKFSAAVRSRGGAVLALVLVTATAVLILAAALLAAANFNVSYTSRGVQGRQAYLSAKSAVEYTRAYLGSHKEDMLGVLTPADTLYVIAKNGTMTTEGFNVKKNAAKGELEGKTYAAVTMKADSTPTPEGSGKYTLTIQATSPQLDKKSAKSLTYQFKMNRTVTVTPPTPGTPGKKNKAGFLLLGQMGANTLFSQTETETSTGSSVQVTINSASGSAPYPLVVNTGAVRVGARQTYTLTAPQMYFMRGMIFSNAGNLVTYADFVCVSGALDLTETSLSAWTMQPKTAGKTPVLFVPSGGLTIKKAGGNITVPGGYYEITPGRDLLKLTQSDWNTLPQVTDAEKLATVKANNFAGDDGSKLANAVSGDSWGSSLGVEWVQGGALYKGSATQWYLSGSSKPTNTEIKGAKVNEIKNKYVYCFIDNASAWGLDTSGMGNRWNSATYQAQSMFLQYVNAANWRFPKDKSVTVRADTSSGTITLQTQAAVDDVETHPEIVAGNYASHFIIYTSKLIVPSPITVRYYKNNGSEQSYTIQPGVYTHSKFQSGGGVDLFHPDGQNAVFEKPADEPLPDYGEEPGIEGTPGSTIVKVEFTDGRYQ